MYALSGYQDRAVRLWELRTGKCVRVIDGHGDGVNSVSMDSACKTAVSGSDDATVKLWDLGSGRCIETYEHGQEADDVMMHESGSSFVSVRRGIVRAWATASGSDQSLLDADLSALCDVDQYMGSAASRDLSRVGVCYVNPDGDKLAVSVWK